MLLIETKVKKSRIAGNGLFTLQNLVTGQVVWRLNPLLDMSISKQAYVVLRSMDLARYIDTYATVAEDGTRQLDGDNCRFMNHSEYRPNIFFVGDIGVAMRDIKRNEELTCNYKEITTPEHFRKLI